MTTGKILGSTYIRNGRSADASDFIPDMSADIYYEIIRMIDGKLLFLQDHIDRLKHSLSGTGVPFPGSEQIHESLKLLQAKNDFKIGNIRLCLQVNQENEFELLCYFVPYVYPESFMYLSGVQLVTYPFIRPNPGIKKWDNLFRVSVNQYIRDHGVYEALLLNSQNQITEGSRSNVFFLDRKGHLVTPPEKDVLPGITRKYVVAISRNEGMNVIERPVHKDDLGEMVSCFISGTSPKILPVCQIDGYQFKPDHPVLRMLMEQFEVSIRKHLFDLSSNAPD